MEISSEYLNDAFSFSSKRRVLFVRLYQRIGSHLGFEQISEQTIVQALEHIHASATIIDDMLDNEHLRKDIPSYYVRHGHSIAAFAALNLMIKGIELISNSTYDINKVLGIIRGMIDAEEADIGLRKRTSKVAPLGWYRDVVSKKIAGELLLILLLCSQGADNSKGALRELERLTILLGQFIQYCDDWYDILIRDPFAQTSEKGAYVLTYSLPLAVYLSHTDDNIEKLVGVKIDRTTAMEIMGKISAPGNRLRVEEFIKDAHQDLVRSLQASLISGWGELAEVADAVRTEAYWERKYYELT
jgi:geranylgeranyl pyrophosphate synthase